MSIITGKHLPRRTFLRGIGATMALPFLDAMAPAFAAAPKPARRLGVVYVPNGMNMFEWRPKTVGAGFDLPSTLSSLAPFQNQLLVMTGMANAEADPRPGEGTWRPFARAGRVPDRRSPAEDGRHRHPGQYFCRPDCRPGAG